MPVVHAVPSLIVFGLLVAAAQAATLVQRPYLQNQHDDRVTIMWSMRDNLPGVVQYSADQVSWQTAAPRTSRAFPPSVTGLSYTFYQYQVELTGLTPGTDYTYRVMVDGQDQMQDPKYRFHTAAPGAFSFLVLGDSGTGYPGQVAVALRLVTEQPDLVLHVGDVGQYVGVFEEYADYYFEYYWSLMRQVPFFSAPGNHDYLTANAVPYLSYQAPPADTVPVPDVGRYYSFTRGDVHFVALDSNLLTDAVATRRMLAWLENDLSTTQAVWRVAFFHHLPYPIEHHVGDPNCVAAQSLLVPIFDRYNVQLVFNGHEHTYQRTKPMRGNTPVSSGMGTVYMVSGGGGGTLHPVVPMNFLAHAESVYHYLRVEADASQITIHAIGTDGKEFDRVSLVRPLLSASTPVLNAASGAPVVAPGGLMSIFGTGLANGTSQSSGSLPLALLGTTVTVNDKPVPLLYASSGQINAQMPYDVRGTAVLRVTTASGFAETGITISDTAPGIFPGGVWHASGKPVTNASPVTAGETLVIYLTGLGAVDGSIAAGEAAPSSPLAQAVAPVEVQIGDRSVKPFFAGLTPGFAGVYQVNVVTPADLAPQVCLLRISAQGNLSNGFSVQVQGATKPQAQTALRGHRR